MYHLCYDDGPHWATEPMQLCFMFENFHKVMSGNFYITGHGMTCLVVCLRHTCSRNGFMSYMKKCTWLQASASCIR